MTQNAVACPGLTCSVDKMSDLMTLPVSDSSNGAQIAVAGYNKISDGGGGRFVYDATSRATQDDGTVFRPNSLTQTQAGRWRRIFDGPLSVKWFGAAGDNVADDTAAFNKAILAVITGKHGTLRIPAGNYKLTGSLNLTNYYGSLCLEGDGKYSTSLHAAMTGTPVLDLTGSSLIKLSNFSVKPVAGFNPSEILLLSRKTDNDSAGDHKFDHLWLQGACQHATVVLWGSEQNLFTNCLIWTTTDVPAMVGAIRISLAGFTPSSPFIKNGTGEGGVSMNTFVATRFGNETGSTQSSPLVKMYGTNVWAYYNCFFTCNSRTTIDINASPYPSEPSRVYPSSVTFDSCLDENAWLVAGTAKNTITFSSFPVAIVGTLRESAKGIHIKNCQFFNIFGDTDTWVDNLIYEGGRYSPSVPVPAGLDKISMYRLDNSRISPSQSERHLKYIIRNQGSALAFDGIDHDKVVLNNVAGYWIFDSSGNANFAKSLLSSGPTSGVGYAGGAGGSVNQTTSSGRAVTLDKVTGTITTVPLTTAPRREETFQVLNSTVAVTDIIVTSTTYKGKGTPFISIKGLEKGTFVVVVSNLHGTDALNRVVTINFAVIKAINV